MGYQLLTNPWVTDQIKYMNQIEAEFRDRLKGTFTPEIANQIMGQFANSPMFQFNAPRVDMSRLGNYQPSMMQPGQGYTPMMNDPNSIFSGYRPQDWLSMIKPQGFGASASTAEASPLLQSYLRGEGKIGQPALQGLFNNIRATTGQSARDAAGATALNASAAGFGQVPSVTAPMQAALYRQAGGQASEQMNNLMFQNEQMGVQNQAMALQQDIARTLQNAGYETNAAMETARNLTQASVSGASNITSNLGQYQSLLANMALGNQSSALQAGMQRAGFGQQANIQNQNAFNQMLQQVYGGNLQAMLLDPQLNLQAQQGQAQFNTNFRNQNLGFLNAYGQLFNPAPYAQMAGMLTPQSGQFVKKSSPLGSILGMAANIGAGLLTGGMSLPFTMGGLGMSQFGLGNMTNAAQSGSGIIGMF